MGSSTVQSSSTTEQLTVESRDFIVNFLSMEEARNMKTTTHQTATTSCSRKEKMGKKTLLMMLPTALEASEMRAIAILSRLRRKMVMRRMMAHKLTLMTKSTSQVSLNLR